MSTDIIWFLDGPGTESSIDAEEAKLGPTANISARLLSFDTIDDGPPLVSMDPDTLEAELEGCGEKLEFSLLTD